MILYVDVLPLKMSNWDNRIKHPKMIKILTFKTNRNYLGCLI